jgi:hypothetical protein
MTLELDYLRRIFQSTIDKHNEIDFQENEIEDEIINVALRLKNSFSSYFPNKKYTFKTFVHFQQSSISRLIKELEDVLEKDIEQEQYEIFGSMLQELTLSLKYLWSYYTEDLNKNTYLPKTFVLHFLSENKVLINQSIDYFKHLEINEELIDILKKALLFELSEKITYNHIIFSRCLIDFATENKSSTVVEETVLEMLISKQFNHPRFYKYCTTSLTEKLNGLPVISDHYRELVYKRKQLAQIAVLDTLSYCENHENIQSSLLKMIDSEIDFLKELDFMNTELINSGLLDSSYKVSFSVKQLAFYIYLNVESGIILEEKATKIHQHVISRISTSEREQISEKSFSNAYYVHSPEDIRKVSDKLAQMLAIAQNKY